MAPVSFSLRSFHQEPYGLCRGLSKEFQTFLPGQITRQEVLGTESLNLRSTQVVDLQISSSLSLVCNQLARPASIVNRPVLIDVQDGRPDSVLFSYGIAEQCIRHEKILQFLTSGSSIPNAEGLDVSLLNDFMGLHTMAINIHPQHYFPMDDEIGLYDIGNNPDPSFRHSQKISYLPNPLVDFVGDMSRDSMMTVHSDGQVMFMRTENEMKDLLSIVAEFYMSRSAARDIRRQQMVVPYFRRSGAKGRGKTQGSLNLRTVTAAPLKSLENTKLRSSPKKKNTRKVGSERDIYTRNYSQVCESLLSVILIKNRDKMAFLSLKKHGQELPQLLTQFSAGIVGTSLAVLFSVAWKLTSGRAPLCTTKLLNTGFALGLVWLSFAVNMLRDTIIDITKNASKLKLKEDEMACKVERSVNEVFFRAAAVMAVVVLRLA